MIKQRILVTGGVGFRGSRFYDALLADGVRVIGVDNSASGNLANLEHLHRESQFAFEKRNIGQPFDVGVVDFVLNFASLASPVDYMWLGLETLLVGSAGSLNAIKIARKIGIGFLQAFASGCGLHFTICNIVTDSQRSTAVVLGPRVR